MFERPLTTLAILAVFSAVLFGAATLPVAYTEYWVDDVSASIRSERKNFWSRPSSALEESELRIWMENHDRSVDYRWTFLFSKSENVLGHTLDRGCGAAPPIYALRGDMMSHYVRIAGDEELTKFTDTRIDGSRIQQEAVVSRASEVALRAIGQAD